MNLISEEPNERHEIRRDPILGRWVIIASGRSNRPNDFVLHEEVPEGGVCPFCYGSEAHTPPEVLAYRPSNQPANTPGWQVRVVPNKYPALRLENSMHKRHEGLYEVMEATGVHEVVIETPEHPTQLSDLQVEHIYLVVRAYRDRMRHLSKDPALRYVLIFKNQGADAGATLEHTHAQIIATPIVPKRVIEEIIGSLEFYEKQNKCVFCAILSQEFESRKRIIWENADFVALAPFASRFPFETWILPKTHAARFENTSDAMLQTLAATLKTTLQRINLALSRPPFNIVLHTAPCHDDSVNEYYHWHFEIMPKLTKVAGFEWGSGFYINPTPPENAARILREVERA